LEVAPRRRGRPRGSTVVPPDLHADIWIAVRLHRIRARICTGKTPSVRQACHELAAEAGITSVVGGNVEALAAENAQRKKRWHRFDSTGSTLTPNATGNHLCTLPPLARSLPRETRKRTPSPSTLSFLQRSATSACVQIAQQNRANCLAKLSLRRWKVSAIIGLCGHFRDALALVDGQRY
jgi:hypothetical protein